MNFGKNLQYDWGGGGGKRLFGTFPKIHLFWKGKASLSVQVIIVRLLLGRKVLVRLLYS